MATAPNLPFVAVDEFLRTDYEPACEYIDGVLLPKPMPDNLHGRLLLALGQYLLTREGAFALSCYGELHTQIRLGKWRVPGLAGFVGKLETRYANSDTPPLFTVEIASLDEPQGFDPADIHSGRNLP